MTAFRVDLEALDLLIERMSAVEAELTEVHDDVESRMRRLQVVWSGRAAAEHQAAFERWSGGAAVTANRAMWAE